MQIVDCKAIRERVLDGVKEKLQVASGKVSLAIVTALVCHNLMRCYELQK